MSKGEERRSGGGQWVVERMRKEMLRVSNVVFYDDGSLDRMPHEPPPLPACPEPLSPQLVATVDLPLNESKGTSLRLFLKPPLVHTKLPILLYFHGGAFIFGSSTLPADHSFLCKLASHASALVVSVEYRLAPEHPLPAAYEDGIEALLWLRKQLLLGDDALHPWISRYGNLSKCFLGGDSAGANLAHHVAMWAATGLGFEVGSTDPGPETASWCAVDGGTRAPAMEGLCLQGVILIHPFFTCGPENIMEIEEMMWKHAGISTKHPFANPLMPSAPCLADVELPCYLVAIASDDYLAGRGAAFHQALVDSGKVSKLFTSQDEGHVFHLLTPDSKNVPAFLDELSKFIKSSSSR